MNPEALQRCRRRLNSRLPLVGGWLRRRALRLLERDGSPEAVALLAALAGGRDQQRLASLALQALRRRAEAGCVEARAALCRLVLEHDHAEARALALAGGYVPRDPATRALFHFLTEQWEAYSALDFDHALLRTAYRAADEGLRRRLAEVARRAGRVEWAEVVGGGLQRGTAEALTDSEWQATLELLASSERWAELWRLAQEAPPRWSARLLRRLHEAGRAPEAAEFAELVALALRWEDPGIGSVLRARTVTPEWDSRITCLAVSPDGRLLVSGREDGVLHLWQLPDGQPLGRLGKCSGVVFLLRFSPDGRFLAAAGTAESGQVQVWGLPERRVVRQLNLPSYLVIDPAFWLPSSVGGEAAESSPRWLLGCSLWELPENRLYPGELAWTESRGWVEARDLQSGQLVRSFKDKDAPFAVALSPDGRMLVSVVWPARACARELPSGKRLTTLSLSNRPVRRLLVGSDGQLFVLTDGHPSIARWALPKGRPLPTLRGHSDSVHSFALSGDGKVLASLDSGGDLRLWGLPEGRPLHDLHTEPCHRGDLRLTLDGLVLGLVSCSRLRLWTSELLRLSRVPVGRISLDDMTWVEGTLGCADVTPADRQALKFILALTRHHRRFDVHVEERAARVAGLVDIELAG
ncbi:MAG: hypothetical protein L0Z62_44975 [Gemmataceae bacterium]|nr:hypothetical protein [Gemmataceae bacterium]